jgi:hypothetical protein
MVTHVKSHPERREADMNKWGNDMWGNYIADRAASGDGHEAFYQWPHVKYFEITATELLCEMGREEMWSQINGKTGYFNMEMLPDVIRKNSAAKYRENRDASRAERGVSALWTDDTPEFAAKCFDQKGCSLATRAQGVRLLMDWGYHGGNRKKGVESQEEKEAVGRCEQDICKSVTRDQQRTNLCSA